MDATVTQQSTCRVRQAKFSREHLNESSQARTLSFEAERPEAARQEERGRRKELGEVFLQI
ncbi:hypothetical protein QUB05_10700 [Microcoleus sp. F10-C6]